MIDFNVAVDLNESPVITGSTGIKKWSAPETRQIGIYGEICDEWSVGSLLMHMLTGLKPGNEETMNKLKECD